MKKSIRVSMTMLLAAMIIAIVALSGCTRVIVEGRFPAYLGKEFQLKVGESAVIVPEQIIITFVDVVQDSRCPADVMCFSSGWITATINIEKDGKDLGNFNIDYPLDSKPLYFDKYYLQSSIDAPDKTSGEKLPLSAYTLKLTVNKVDTQGDVQANLGEEFSLKGGESAYIESEKLLIEFTNITQDSRCPIDVLCTTPAVEGYEKIVGSIEIKQNGNDIGGFELRCLLHKTCFWMPKPSEKVYFGDYYMEGSIDAPDKTSGEELPLSAYTLKLTVNNVGSSEVCAASSGEKMEIDEARQIAESSDCTEEGALKDTYFCNNYTGTWWIDLNIDRQGCAPACVIDVSTKTAEINWRCIISG